MVVKTLASFILGAGVGYATGVPAEWYLHRNTLHRIGQSGLNSDQKKKESRIPFVNWYKNQIRNFEDNAWKGHEKIHHKVYDFIGHFRKDKTNEKEVMHFNNLDRVFIAAGAATTGHAINRLYVLGRLALDKGYALSLNNNSFDWNDVAFIVGFASGIMGYYLKYEIIHHIIHDGEKESLPIRRKLGDKIQGGDSDGKFRLSEPLFSDFCNQSRFYRDNSAEQHKIVIEPYMVDSFKEQIRMNPGKAKIAVSEENLERALKEVIVETMHEEQELISKMSRLEKIKHSAQRKIEGYLYRSSWFEKKKNHHLLHHRYFGKNLGVASTLADRVFGTLIDSSREELEKQKNWICHTSPDDISFSLPEDVSREEAVAA